MSARTGRCLKLLEKCKNIRQLKQSHAQSITCGLGQNSFALSRLLAFFCAYRHPDSPIRGNNLSHALNIYHGIENPTNCISNTMIKACLLGNDQVTAIHLYKHMLGIGLRPDNYTFPYVLKASANMKSCHLGELIHGHCVKFGFVFDVFVGNTLIFMYSSFDDMEAAQYVFDEIPSHSVVAWTVLISGYAKRGDAESARLLFDEALVKDRGVWGSMISGYVQNNCFKEGLQLFHLMQSTTDILPDEAIFVSVLCACAHLGALDIGIWIHRHLIQINMHASVRLGTALIDMYAKCGKLYLAERVFEEMPERDTICWNAMISGLAMHGDGVRALGLFMEMERARVQPDDITFISIFAACSYSGMEYEGLKLFLFMHNVYKVEPKAEHYGCVIDFLGRAGLFEEAVNIIQNMPKSCSPSEEAIAWRTLLNACQGHGQIEIAEIAAERLLQLECHSGVYVLLSNMYSSVGIYDNAKRIRTMMKSRGIQKIPGCSSVEVNGVVHEFIAVKKALNKIKASLGWRVVYAWVGNDPCRDGDLSPWSPVSCTVAPHMVITELQNWRFMLCQLLGLFLRLYRLDFT